MAAVAKTLLIFSVAAMFTYELVSTYSPNFVGDVESFEANEGETARFTCQVENLTKYRKVGWFRLHPRRIISIGLTMKSQDPRLSVMHDGNMKWTLQITNVTQYDKGKYQCAVNFKRTLISQFGYLRVRVKDQCNLRPYLVRWRKIKAKLVNSKIEKADIKEIILQSRTNVKGIDIKWCPSLKTSCPHKRTQCKPSSLEKRNASIVIDVWNTQRLLHFSYLEAKECICKFCHSKENCTHRFPIVFKPRITDVPFKPDFFLAETIDMTWETVKKQVRRHSQVSDPEVFKILRKSKLTNDYRIPVKKCLFHSCEGHSVSMIPAEQLIKHISLPIKVKNDTKIAMLEYIEMTRCYCNGKLKVRLMETILHVKIAELCQQPNDFNESGITQTSYVGCDHIMPFYIPSVSEDATRITVIRATNSWKPLLIRSPLRNDLATYGTSQSWDTNVGSEICDGLVELHLKNVTYAFNDTYYSSVEFKNSSACFSQVNLLVAEKIPEKGCSVTWKPVKTSLDWNTFLRRVDNATFLTELIPKETGMDETFTLQTCPAEAISCQGPLKPRHCIASRSRTRLKTVCVPRGNDDLKMEIEYEEDDSCECKLRNVPSPLAMANDDPQETKPIDIVRAEQVGNCPSACRPQAFKVKWPYIREVINKQTFYSLPGFLRGKNIWVHRCPQDLTTCEATGKKCSAHVFEKKTKKMKLKFYKRLFVVKYLQVKECKCKRANRIHPYNSELFILKNFTSKRLEE